MFLPEKYLSRGDSVHTYVRAINTINAIKQHLEMRY